MNANRQIPVERQTQWVLYALLVCALVWFTSGCDRSDCTGVGSADPTGRLVGLTGCKTWDAEALTGSVSSSHECIEWRYYRRGILLLKHVNAGFNCCPEIDAAACVEADTIFIREHEIEGLCECLCLFDLDYEITDLAPGVYTVAVSGEYLNEGDEPLVFTMDLRRFPSGRHCVERDHYPWGL